jgi:hypothetical protein
VTDRSADNHPALEGRGPEARRLADAVRRLIELTVTNTAPPEATAAIATELEGVADRLATHLPETPFPRFMFRPPPEGEEGIVDGSDDGDPPLGGHMPYDPVVGAFNPLALPVSLEFDAPKAIIRARFTTPYEGAPGCVHGSVLMATFDIVLTAANAIVGAMGPTVRLATRFRRPTLLHEECVFEGWVTEVTERRVHSLGRIVQNGTVTVEAEGEFAIIDPEGIAAMARRRREEADAAAS